MTTASTVHAILARCLIDATFCEHLASHKGDVLGRFGLDDAASRDFMNLDFRIVRRFAGQITKVQSNGLWQWFPFTRQMLKSLGLELEVFTAYSAQYQRARATRELNRAEQTSDFVKFLFMQPCVSQLDVYPGLRDLLLHEELNWSVQTAAAAGGGMKSPDPRLGPRSGDGTAVGLNLPEDRSPEDLVPVVRGFLRVGEFCYDPLEIIAALKADALGRRSRSKSSRFRVYWADAGRGELRIMDLDQIGASLLSHVDGRQSICAIVSKADAGGPVGDRAVDFMGFFRTALGLGMLELRLP
ncbi:MAG: hypothetical protein P4L84_00860 [Isosphaeraceae bacterium]|nr:hypothetical protein [Isosphaeraceae bacterium]